MFIYQLRCELKKFQITSQTEGLELLYSLILQSLLHVVKRHVGFPRVRKDRHSHTELHQIFGSQVAR